MILAVAVIVEIWVGIIEQDAAGVLLDQLITFGRRFIVLGRLFITRCGFDGLAEGGGIFKQRKNRFRKADCACSSSHHRPRRDGLHPPAPGCWIQTIQPQR